MARQNYSVEQIIVKLREVEVLCSQGKAVGEAVRQIGVTEQMCCNDEMAQGTQRAAAQAGQEGIVFVGFGGNEFILDPIENGEIAATISINPYDMGKTSVLEMVKVVKGESIDAFVDTGASLITLENLEEYRASLK